MGVMKYDKRGSVFVLSTGRRLHGNGEFRLGLADHGDHVSVTYGYDGDAHYGYPDDEDDDDSMRPLSTEERQEIARYMIDAWQRWAETGSV